MSLIAEITDLLKVFKGLKSNYQKVIFITVIGFIIVCSYLIYPQWKSLIESSKQIEILEKKSKIQEKNI